MSEPIQSCIKACAVQDELRHVRALLQLEQKEEQAQFKLKNASASIKERRRRGLTWYPVSVTQEDIGFGGKVVLELERPAHRQDLHLFQVGASAALFSNAPGYSGPDRPLLSGVVTSVRRNKLVLATTKEELPDWVINGNNPNGSTLNGSSLNGSTLGIDLTFDEVSYREMNQALTEVMGAHDNRLAHLRDVLMGAMHEAVVGTPFVPNTNGTTYVQQWERWGGPASFRFQKRGKEIYAVSVVKPAPRSGTQDSPQIVTTSEGAALQSIVGALGKAYGGNSAKGGPKKSESSTPPAEPDFRVLCKEGSTLTLRGEFRHIGAGWIKCDLLELP